MGITDKIIKFSIKKNLKKWIQGGGTTLVALAVPQIAKYTGVSLTAEQQGMLSIAAASAIVGLSNFLKQKFPGLKEWL